MFAFRTRPRAGTFTRRIHGRLLSEPLEIENAAATGADATSADFRHLS